MRKKVGLRKKARVCEEAANGNGGTERGSERERAYSEGSECGAAIDSKIEKKKKENEGGYFLEYPSPSFPYLVWKIATLWLFFLTAPLKLIYREKLRQREKGEMHFPLTLSKHKTKAFLKRQTLETSKTFQRFGAPHKLNS